MAATVQISPPESFDSSRPAKWSRRIRHFQSFCIVRALDEKEQQTQVNLLLYAIGDTDDGVLAVLPLTDTDKKRYEAVKTVFEQHYRRKHNVIFERAQFNSRR